MDICNLDVENALDVFSQLKFDDNEMKIVKLVIKEINARLGFMNNVGVELSRTGASC